MDNQYKVALNLEKLRSEVIAREDKKFQTFEKLLNMCYNKIINTNKTSSDLSCSFIVPRMVFGLPLFDINECIKYIMTKLTEKGFEVHLAIPNKLLISWRPDSESQATYCRELYQLESGNTTGNGNSNRGRLAIGYGGPIEQQSRQLGNSGRSDLKLFSAKPDKNNQKKYKPIEEYHQSQNMPSIYEPDDISLFRNKIDELFT
jgi:hypothetical protein